MEKLTDAQIAEALRGSSPFASGGSFERDQHGPCRLSSDAVRSALRELQQLREKQTQLHTIVDDWELQGDFSGEPRFARVGEHAVNALRELAGIEP